MSIHKSKGLEFPVVILSDLARRFSNMDFLSSVLVHPQLGLGPVCVDTQRHIQYPTVARQALERTLRREAKAEELRVLYVAMTRAKEKLVMVHTQANAKSRVADLLALSDCPVLPEAVDSGKCMGDWIMLPLLQRSEAASLRELAGQNGEGRFYADETPWTVRVHDGLSFVTPQQRPDDAPVDAAPPKEELPVDFAALSYRYPYAGQTAFPAKLTATQLKGRALDEEISENTTLPPRLRSLYKPKFLAGETTLTGAERGTALHLVMQDLDFFCEASEQSVREQVEKLRALRKLTDERDKLAAENARLQVELAGLQKRLEQAQADNDALSGQVNALAQEGSDLAEQLKKSEETRQELLARPVPQPAEPEEPAPQPEEPEESEEPEAAQEPSLTEKELTAYRRAEQTERNAAVRARRIYAQLSNLCEDARTRYMDSGEEIAALAADLSTGLSRLQDAFAEVQVIFDDAQNAFDDMQLPETAAEETAE